MQNDRLSGLPVLRIAVIILHGQHVLLVLWRLTEACLLDSRDVWKSKASIDREMSVLLVTVMLN